MCNPPSDAPPQKPRVQIKHTKTSLGWAYRIYVDGNTAAGLTEVSARKSVPQALDIHARSKVAEERLRARAR